MRVKRSVHVSILVLGMGNILRGDDGVGVYALRCLAEEKFEGVDFLELGTSLSDCFFALEGYDHVVALDAVAGGGVPGTPYWLSKERFARMRERRMTLHDGDLLEALELAALRGKEPVLHVAGLEPLRCDEWSTELSEPVRVAFPAYLDMVRAHLRELEGEGKDGERVGSASAPRLGG